MNKGFSFEVQVLDSMGIRRKFKGITNLPEVKITPFVCALPIKLTQGWNQVQFNLAEFTKKAWGTDYVET